MQTLRGLAVSPGVAIGPVVVLDPRGLPLPQRNIDAAEIDAHLERLGAALADAHDEAQLACDDARRRLGPQYADILAAHARMIDDPTLRHEARTRIQHDLLAAEHAVVDVLDGYAQRLAGLADAHLAARAADVRDIEARILRCFRALSGNGPEPTAPAAGPALVLADDISPSQAAVLDPLRTPGFATEDGGRTSHTAIVAAALEIPAVVGLGKFLDRARRASEAIIDGDEGLLILDPDPPTLERYRRASVERAERFAGLTRLVGLPSETPDGATIALMGNIEFPAEAAACLERGAVGIGLYRTEFLYLGADRPPTEDEQYEAYAAVVRAMQGRPVTIRTLDLGADKFPSAGISIEDPGRNPFLGLRSIRVSLQDPTLFRTQLRAILRASALGDVRAMFPMVSTIGEWRQARGVLADVAAGLDAEGVAFRRDMPLGVMIEVPAAALMADRLAREVDFFSIGTNDLIQYTLAVDRTNQAVAYLYNGADPSVLRLIAAVVEAAARHGRDVTVCGSMGGDPLYTMLLLGLGLRALSMPPHQIPEVKRVIRVARLDKARDLAAAALDLDTAETVAEALRLALDESFAEPQGRPGPHA